ncbi:hypothetical protein TPA0910_29530 [Streptomyces hygroscopicus subsp. sporocinereus]|uniref:Uncharacterized protein n=1 Tax=Streptomyces hygroscopicus TaxID=1912 RepID=A0ABQ3TYS0_STRHY|nr:hypothetical protein TPA0910_29530 [Streptomyces hygroscopicus]
MRVDGVILGLAYSSIRAPPGANRADLIPLTGFMWLAPVSSVTLVRLHSQPPDPPGV